jgi:hypothetical protein
MHMNGAEPQSESCVQGEPTESFCAEFPVPLPLLSLPQPTVKTMQPPQRTMNRRIISSSSGSVLARCRLESPRGVFS